MKKAPEIAEALARVDTLLVDLQDVGVRYYTFVSTLVQVLEAARAGGTRVVVLDRPNPLGFSMEGPVLRPEFRSFVGMLEIPLRHGLSVGECARFVDPEVDVVRCDPLEAFSQSGLPWVFPSPNLPHPETALLYAGLGLVEVSAASEGRGTTLPFQLAGAPGVDAAALAERLNRLGLGPFRFRPAYFVPTISKHRGETCAGVQVHLTGNPERVLPVGLALVGALAEQGQAINPDWAQKLLGIPYERSLFDPDTAVERCQTWETEAGGYARRRLSQAWLYPR